MFESSLYQSKFLGFERNKDDPSVDKLILRHKGKDEVDESCEIMFSECACNSAVTTKPPCVFD